MRDLSIIRKWVGGLFKRRRVENNGVEEQRIETTSESPNKKMNETRTHILRFPPGARVTLTNRRLYCALFPVLLVKSRRLCGWLGGWMADCEQCLAPAGRKRYRVSRLTIEGSKFHHIPPALRSISLFQHHFGLNRMPFPYSNRPSIPMSTAVAISFIQIRSCRFDPFAVRGLIRLPIRADP